jgi:hypothetical protein
MPVSDTAWTGNHFNPNIRSKHCFSDMDPHLVPAEGCTRKNHHPSIDGMRPAPVLLQPNQFQASRGDSPGVPNIRRPAFL